MDLTRNSLFYNINENEQLEMMNCFSTSIRKYKAGEIICFFDEKERYVGIIETGEACIVHSFESGVQTVLEYLTTGDIFGGLFYHYANPNSMSVQATEDCEIRFIDYEHIIKRCNKACAHHSQLVNNLLSIMSDKTQNICEHLEVLSQRCTRDKLLSFFEILSKKNKSKSFVLPFNLTVLADYLSVDRSSMSRELSKMKTEQIIKMSKKKITLLNK